MRRLAANQDEPPHHPGGFAPAGCEPTAISLPARCPPIENHLDRPEVRDGARRPYRGRHPPQRDGGPRAALRRRPRRARRDPGRRGPAAGGRRRAPGAGGGGRRRAVRAAGGRSPRPHRRPLHRPAADPASPPPPVRSPRDPRPGFPARACPTSTRWSRPCARCTGSWPIASTSCAASRRRARRWWSPWWRA